jgi:GTP-binding protein
MFVDHIRIFAKAGDGGNGCSSFRREKFVPKGGPDGGDGGGGGDVELVVDPHTDNLRDFFYKHNYLAEKGSPGQGAKKTGRSGKNLVLKVPPGTVVYRTEAPAPKRKREEVFDADDEAFDEEEADEWDAGDDEIFEVGDTAEPEVVADLTVPGQRFTLCRGGVGGKGNWRFRTDTNQAPIEFTEGTKGEEGWFFLELRRIADIGLVGFPNAGKSTLLGALSNATPKVASYPFTTLTPMVGVVEFPGFYRTTVADIPGLIEGAHRNVGLGHDFLRHISRCSIFLFVVDTAGVDDRDPVSDIEVLRQELKLYDERLTDRAWLIVANKMDLPESAERLDALKTRFPKQEILPISADTGLGLETLKARLCELTGRRPG